MNKLSSLLIVGLILQSCSNHEAAFIRPGAIGAAVAAVSIKGNGLSQAGPTTPVSGGTDTLGAAGPTGAAAVARIENGLEGLAKSTTGNFRNALTQARSNLPKVTNVTNASGYEQIQLLAYAACSDLTTGGTPMMQSKYNVVPSASISTNQSALIAAGLRILDQHTAGIASQGPASAQLTTILTNLVAAQAAITSNTSKMAFMTVCIAANTAGSTLLGM